MFFVSQQKLSFINLNNNRIKVIAVDFKPLKSVRIVLGFGNICADFYLNKKFNAENLDALIKANCSQVAATSNETNIRITSAPIDTTKN